MAKTFTSVIPSFTRPTYSSSAQARRSVRPVNSHNRPGDYVHSVAYSGHTLDIFVQVKVNINLRGPWTHSLAPIPGNDIGLRRAILYRRLVPKKGSRTGSRLTRGRKGISSSLRVPSRMNLDFAETNCPELSGNGKQ